ncbi:hypothetical protein BpHYR1_051898 [Brachionus plicatilis]|uniref:C2H2-type domain-containing protein n=1 Tax=Brachionus plicatilis TaxID=10195 RepID=A0A3M7RLL7_BRAPC|nr:hypothetical protein BpHYR1_051898 [Brachionus plicatilis]
MNLYSTEHQKLNFAYVQEILSKFNHKETPYVDFIKDPRPGNVVIFWIDDTQKKRDWVVDGLKWRSQEANKPFPANDPVLFKSYYLLIDKDGLVTKEFKKESFYLKGQNLPVLIHYMVSQKAPFTVYKSTSKKKGHRDLKQCQNLRYAVNRQKRFTYDEIAKIHLMHVSFGFPNLILTAPDVRINEIKYGFGNLGVYRLRLEYKEMCFVDTRYISTHDTMEPTQIIKSLIVNKDEVLRTEGVKFTTVSDSSEANDTNSDAYTETDSQTVLKTNSSTLKNTETLEGTLTEDDVSQDELMTKPYELKSNYNTKIGRALWMVNHDKVKLDARLRLYLVEDEQKNLFQVKLLPKYSCICVEKGNCAHILAVQHLNGIDISNQYKLTNIAKITKAKNSGSTGRKRRGHHVNSIETNKLAGDNVDDNAVAEATCDLRMRSILKQLILEETNLDKFLSKDSKIKLSMLTTNQSKLSDVFLTQINLDKDTTTMSQSTEHLFVVDTLPEYKDHFGAMKPHQAFVYKLGLELCLSHVTQDDNAAEQYDAQVIQELHQRNKCFRHPYCQCQTCGFRTESRLAMDSHLTEPHQFTSSNVCNFCPFFKAKSRDKYHYHLETVHKRVPKVEKPFIDYALMCPICDYETTITTVSPKAHDLERTLNHVQNACPFRQDNQQAANSLNIDYNHILANNLSPSLFDLLDYEFLFHSKPREAYVNKFGLFSSSLMKTNSLLASMAVHEETFMIHLTKLMQTMVPNANPESQAARDAARPKKAVTVNNKPVQTMSRDASPIKCDLCSVTFMGVFSLVNYETHLKSVHCMRNIQDLRACLSKCFRPAGPPSPAQHIKLIKVKQNLVLVKKSDNHQVAPVKRPIELIELDKDEVVDTKCAKNNENTDIFVQVKLKEIEAEKKFIFSLLKTRKNDSDLVELKGIQATCYVCKKMCPNMLAHLLTEHHVDPRKSLQLNRCILCGTQPADKNELIKHQYQVHGIISFLSLNKIFTVDKSADKQKEEEGTKSVEDDDCIIIDSHQNDVSINLTISSQNSSADEKVPDNKLAKKCIKCAKQFDTFIQLLNHVKKDHENLKNGEPAHTEKKTDEQKMDDSVASSVSGKKCQFCSIEMESSEDYEQHLVASHMKAFEIRLKKMASVGRTAKDKNAQLEKEDGLAKENSADRCRPRRSNRFRK